MNYFIAEVILVKMFRGFEIINSSLVLLVESDFPYFTDILVLGFFHIIDTLFKKKLSPLTKILII